MENKKIDFIQNLKTFCIILIVSVHVASLYCLNILNIKKNNSSGLSFFGGDSVFFSEYVFVGYAFLMTVFFFFGGYFGVRSIEKYGSIKFLVDRAKRLLIPFLIFSPIIIFISYIENYYNLSLDNFVFNYNDFFAFIKNFDLFNIFLKPYHLWFLVFLFILYIFHVLISKIGLKFKKNNFEFNYKNLFVLIFILGIISFLLKIFEYNYDFLNNYRIDYAGIYILAYVSGIYFQKNDLLLKNYNLKYLDFLLIGLSGIILSLIFFHPDFGIFYENNVFGFNLSNLVFSLIQSTIAITFTILLFCFVKEKFNYTNKILNFLGEYSFGVYLIHFPLIFLAKNIEYLLFYNNYLNFFTYIIITLILSYFLAFILKNIPFLKKIL